jgi:hypothetical protein
MRKKVETSTYIQGINTLERKLLKQVKELDDIIQKHPEIMFRLQTVMTNLYLLKNRYVSKRCFNICYDGITQKDLIIV